MHIVSYPHGFRPQIVPLGRPGRDGAIYIYITRGAENNALNKFAYLVRSDEIPKNPAWHSSG